MAGTASASAVHMQAVRLRHHELYYRDACTASGTMSQKMPCTPAKLATIGPAIKATTNESPMVTPTNRHRLGAVLLGSEVRHQRQDHRADRARALQ